MGLAILILGLVVFLGVHVLTSLRDRRAKLVERLGVGPYKGLYSVLAIIGFVLIVSGSVDIVRLAGSTSGIRRHGYAKWRPFWLAGIHIRRRGLYPGRHLRANSSIRCWSASSCGPSRI